MSDRPAHNAGRRPLPLAVVLLFGPAFFAMGLLVFGVLTGQVPANPGALRVQPAILGLIAFLFCTSGLGLMMARWQPKLAGFLGVIAFCCFVGLFNWIAFGPGDREFTRGKSGGSATPVSELESRLVFGLFAGALDILILYGLYHGLKRRSAAARPRDG
ncbi:MAG: hypothetical protein FJY44_04540 [Betaproteobacteria bacterium]|nr:hypothetical protein [Betaproteobacteria bacterium]